MGKSACQIYNRELIKRGPYGCNIFVLHLPPTFDDEKLSLLFSKFSESIISSKVCIDPHTQRTKGYGFVSFSNKEAAMKAIESKNDAIVEGNRLRVRLKDKEYKKY